MNKISRPSVVLLFLLFVFIAPGMIAYILYMHPHYAPSAKTNRGELLQPPVLMRALPETARWTLLLWYPAETCDERCMHLLDTLARIRLALGRRLYDVDVLILTPQTMQFSDAATTFLTTNAMHKLAWPSQAFTDHNFLFENKPALFLVNPQRYVILRYAANAASDDVYHDLKHLLAGTGGAV